MGIKIGGKDYSAKQAVVAGLGGPTTQIADVALGGAGSQYVLDAASKLDPTKKPNYGQVGAPNPEALKQIDTSKYSMPQGLQAAQLNTSPQDQFRAQQLALTNQLSQQAQGVGPSVAQNQLRQGQSANLAATMAQLASARGGANPGLARQALQTAANIQNQTNQAAATARLQEQMQAAGLLGQVAGGARGQDINIAQQNADLQQNFQGLQQKYMSMGLGAEQANQQAALDFERLRQGGAQFNASQDTLAEQARRQQIGQILNAGGAIGAAYAGNPAGLMGAGQAPAAQSAPSQGVNNPNAPGYDWTKPTVEGPARPR